MTLTTRKPARQWASEGGALGGAANLSSRLFVLNLDKQLSSVAEHSDKWHSLKDEIAKTDKLIDQKVYELYGLSGEEGWWKGYKNLSTGGILTEEINMWYNEFVSKCP